MLRSTCKALAYATHGLKIIFLGVRSNSTSILLREGHPHSTPASLRKRTQDTTKYSLIILTFIWLQFWLRLRDLFVVACPSWTTSVFTDLAWLFSTNVGESHVILKYSCCNKSPQCLDFISSSNYISNNSSTQWLKKIWALKSGLGDQILIIQFRRTNNVNLWSGNSPQH